jgi:hypothetical protein
MNTVITPTLRWVALATALSLAAFVPLGAQQASQRSYATPEDAANAFFTAAKNDSMEDMKLVLGPEVESILASGDATNYQKDRKAFLENFEEMHRFVTGPDEKTATLYVGAENWPFPIPLVEKNGAWFFDTEKGKQEILHRRIGRNEHATIRTMRELTDAQKEYAGNIRWTTDVSEYAQQFSSDDGKHNGLYWKTSEGQTPSYVGTLVAEAAQPVGKDTSVKAAPFHGYIYRMLPRQGKNAPGGAMNYMVNGKMTRGFAFLAYPAEYKSSGVLTFIVGQDGQVYEKDLGPNTAQVASSMMTFNPDRTWRAVK